MAGLFTLKLISTQIWDRGLVGVWYDPLFDPNQLTLEIDSKNIPTLHRQGPWGRASIT